MLRSVSVSATSRSTTGSTTGSCRRAEARAADGVSRSRRRSSGSANNELRARRGSRLEPNHLLQEVQFEATVPTVADRIAQTVVAMCLEPEVEPVFHPDSYGYRPGRSALDALGVCRQRCWRTDWVIDLDIRSFFDSVDHDLVLKAVAAHTDQAWILLYVQRWLKAPLQHTDGSVVPRDRGTPQGSAISPLLANLFMHYAFDAWMAGRFPTIRFERYCDDVVVHCVSERQALFVRDSVARRREIVKSCGTELDHAASFSSF